MRRRRTTLLEHGLYRVAARLAAGRAGRLSPRTVSLLGNFCALSAGAVLGIAKDRHALFFVVGLLHLGYVCLDELDGVLARRSDLWPEHLYRDHALDALVPIYYGVGCFRVTLLSTETTLFAVASFYFAAFIWQLKMFSEREAAPLGVTELNTCLALLVFATPLTLPFLPWEAMRSVWTVTVVTLSALLVLAGCIGIGAIWSGPKLEIERPPHGNPNRQ